MLKIVANLPFSTQDTEAGVVLGHCFPFEVVKIQKNPNVFSFYLHESMQQFR